MTTPAPAEGTGGPMQVRGGDRVLNVGSGGRPNPAWTNLDIMGVLGWVRRLTTRTKTPNFVKHRLPRPLPFPDERFDAIYCAQVIEHFDRKAAAGVLREFRRVLTEGGFARVIVPDLERQAVDYLTALERVRSDPSERNGEEFEFTKLWMIEQFVRRTPGGELTGFLANASPELTSRVREQASRPNRMVAALPSWMRHLLVIRTGQLHQWAYDGYELVNLAKAAGFTRVDVVSGSTSARTDFIAFDNDAKGELQPGSLYIECFR